MKINVREALIFKRVLKNQNNRQQERQQPLKMRKPGWRIKI